MFQRSSFIMVIAFVDSHIYHTSKTLLVTMALAKKIDIIFTTEAFLEVATEISPEGCLNPQSLSFIKVP